MAVDTLVTPADEPHSRGLTGAGGAACRTRPSAEPVCDGVQLFLKMFLHKRP